MRQNFPMFTHWRSIDSLTFLLLALLAALLPFELIVPRVEGAGLRWTNLELLFLLLFIMSIATACRRGDCRTSWRDDKRFRGTVGLILLWLGAALLSAWGAGQLRNDALRATARLATGPLLFLITDALVTTSRRQSALLWALLVGAGLSAVLGLLETRPWPLLDPLWTLFKSSSSRVGGALRVSGPFPYATTAALYWELTAPVAALMALRTTAPLRRRLAWLIAALCSVATLLTLARSGLVLLWLGALTVAGGAIVVGPRPAWLKPIARRGIALWLLGLALATTTLFAANDLYRARLSSENDLAWYVAAYEAPPTLTFEATALPIRVTIRAFNQGQVAWQPRGPQRIRLEGRWLNAAGDGALALPPLRVPLAQVVEPQQSVAIDVSVDELPADGRYRIVWGMAQSDQFHFYHRGSPEATSEVTVHGSSATTPPAVSGPAFLQAPQPLTVGRRALWGAAIDLWRGQPLLGIGADNFRYRYGPRLGLSEWDERLTVNNLYLELLADLGVVGLALFLTLVSIILLPLLRSLRAGRATDPLLSLAVALALLLYLAHGLVDVFIWQNGAHWLFWLLLGVGGRMAHGMRSGSDPIALLS